MVIQIIDVHGVAIFEPKRHPPVTRDGHRVVSPHATLERVQSKARNIHSLRTTRIDAVVVLKPLAMAYGASSG